MVLTWNQAELGDFSKLPCKIVKLRIVERETEESVQKFLAFPCWPLWEGCRSVCSYPCLLLISGSAAEVPFTPAGTWGLNSHSSFQWSLHIWLGSLVAVCFQLAFLLKQNESYELLSPKLGFSECIENYARGWEPPWQILNTRWCFQGTIPGCCCSEGCEGTRTGETSVQSLIFSKLVCLGCPKLCQFLSVSLQNCIHKYQVFSVPLGPECGEQIEGESLEELWLELLLDCRVCGWTGLCSCSSPLQKQMWELGEMESKVFLQITCCFCVGTAGNCLLPGKRRQQRRPDLKAHVMGQSFVTVAAV